MAKGLSVHVGLNAVDPTHHAGWAGPLAACEFDASIARANGFQPTVPEVILRNRSVTQLALATGLPSAGVRGAVEELERHDA
jgi:metacaspase-1